MSKELEAKEKIAVQPEGEHTKAGPVFSPTVDIQETEDGLTLLADMPGVEKEGLTIDLEDNVLTIRGAVKPAADGDRKILYKEYEEGDYFRQFTLPEVIAQDKISANLKNGVLTLVLPKIEPAKLAGSKSRPSNRQP